MASFDAYTSPLSGRYACPVLVYIYSPRSRHSTWRQLWLWLAKGEQKFGLSIPADAIAQMEAHLTVTDADFAIAAEEEKRRRHDVMAHVHAFAQACPAAAGIIHLGATSCFVTDNAEQILQARALDHILPKLAGVCQNLKHFAWDYREMPCLAYTHGQPAQPTTIGRRACLWLHDFLKDLRDLRRVREDIELRSVKGTTGTQASFLELFDGDHGKVEALDEYVTAKAGFKRSCSITSQTYSRTEDLRVMNAFTAFAANAHKFAVDIRQLARDKQMEEPFEKDQIGSSAMAYKRNPMRCERICSLAQLLMRSQSGVAAMSANQWLERSLDDSALRRIEIPEMNLLADAILNVLDNVTSGLVVYPEVVTKQLREELPFMATESLIMALSRKGVSRQEAHERIRVHSHAASGVVKGEAKPNDFMDRVRGDAFFEPIKEELGGLLEPSRFVGRAPQQAEKFLAGEVAEALEPYKEALAGRSKAELHV